jgi:hypothetical protein
VNRSFAATLSRVAFFALRRRLPVPLQVFLDVSAEWLPESFRQVFELKSPDVMSRVRIPGSSDPVTDLLDAMLPVAEVTLREFWHSGTKARPERLVDQRQATRMHSHMTGLDTNEGRLRIPLLPLELRLFVSHARPVGVGQPILPYFGLLRMTVRRLYQQALEFASIKRSAFGPLTPPPSAHFGRASSGALRAGLRADFLRRTSLTMGPVPNVAALASGSLRMGAVTSGARSARTGVFRRVKVPHVLHTAVFGAVDQATLASLSPLVTRAASLGLTMVVWTDLPRRHFNVVRQHPAESSYLERLQNMLLWAISHHVVLKNVNEELGSWPGWSSSARPIGSR